MNNLSKLIVVMVVLMAGCSKAQLSARCASDADCRIGLLCLVRPGTTLKGCSRPCARSLECTMFRPVGSGDAYCSGNLECEVRSPCPPGARRAQGSDYCEPE